MFCLNFLLEINIHWYNIASKIFNNTKKKSVHRSEKFSLDNQNFFIFKLLGIPKKISFYQEREAEHRIKESGKGSFVLNISGFMKFIEVNKWL